MSFDCQQPLYSHFVANTSRVPEYKQLKATPSFSEPLHCSPAPSVPPPSWCRVHAADNAFPGLGGPRAQHGSLHMAFLPGLCYFYPQAKDRIQGLPLWEVGNLCQPARLAQLWPWSPAPILECPLLMTSWTGHAHCHLLTTAPLAPTESKIMPSPALILFSN